MKSKSIFTLPLLFFANSVLAQAPDIEWQTSLGGSQEDYAFSVEQINPNKYVVLGSTFSIDGDVTGLHGINDDYWFTELDKNGALTMQKCLGGTLSETGYSAITPFKGGFALAGNSFSNDGDVDGDHHGTVGLTTDYWVVRMNKQGNIKWAKSFGGSNPDDAYDIAETPEGGLIIAGESESSDGDVTGNHSDDIWIVKTDALGNLIWQRCYGGSGREVAYSIVATTDHCYVVAGATTSADGDVEGQHNAGFYDFWIFKIDENGEFVWKKTLGGKYSESPFDIEQTKDGGFIVAGYSDSDDGDVSNNHGFYDYWVVRLDKDGNLIWERSLGGSLDDEAIGVAQTKDGGFIVTGEVYSSDGNVSYNHGDEDIWVVKLKKSGAIEWEKSLGGSEQDLSWRITQTLDDGYIISGTSYSNDGDITGHHGLANTPDFWIVKLNAQPQLERTTVVQSQSLEEVSIFPNPSSSAFTIEESFNDVSTEFAEINLINANGITAYHIRGSVCDGKLNMTLTPDVDLPKGIYLLQIIAGNRSYCRTIIRD